MKKIILSLLFITTATTFAQVGINTTTPDPSSMLDISATDKGVLVPRMTDAQKLAITSPATGLLIYQSDGVAGFYYFNGTTWTPIAGPTTPSEIQRFGNVIRNTTNLTDDNFIIGSTTLDDDTSIATDDNRMFFNKVKGAFRAGDSDNSTNWNDVNIGTGSVAFGRSTRASGLYSTAFGGSTFATGQNAVSSGSLTTASGENSTAMGVRTRAQSYAETAIGSYNTLATTPNTTSFVATDRLFTVGNGANSSALSNALTILKNGNTAIGNINPTEKLDVDGKTKTTNLQVTTGAVAGSILTSDAVGNATWQTPAISPSWSLTGNAATATDFLGTTNDQDIRLKRNNINAGFINEGNKNSAYGVNTLITLTPNVPTMGVSGNANNAFGTNALRLTTSGYSNSAFGNGSLTNNTTGFLNNAFGRVALNANTTGDSNSAFGDGSLFFNLNGVRNSAFGRNSLYDNTSGSFNSAFGLASMQSNVSGSNNTAVGYFSLSDLTTGNSNIALGVNAQVPNITGNNQMSIGNTVYGLGMGTPNPKIGIGTNAPNAPLQFSNGLGNRKIVLFEGADNDNQFYGFGVTNNILRYQVNAIADNHVFYAGANSGMSSELMRIQGNGNVGIGVVAPTEKLDVDGKTKTTNLQVVTATPPVIGQVLTATDALGNMTWQTPAVAAPSEIQKFGNVIRNTSALAIDNFIIGSTTLDDDTSIATDNNRMFFNKAKGAFRAGNTNNGTNWDNTNIGIGSVAFGINTKASGLYSTAFGVSTSATGQYAVSSGLFTTASGENSTAMGGFTTALGDNSTAMGVSTRAQSYAETAIGTFNTVAITPDGANFIPSDRLFTIGNGANAGALSNALTILKNGNFGIGTSTPNAPLQFSNGLGKRKIVLFEGANNDNQFYGFGVTNNVLRYQVNALADNHVFYAGLSNSASSELMRIQGNGNVGIGVVAPTEKLDVAGKTKTTNLQVVTATVPAIGQVLTATDALGNMTWQTPAVAAPSEIQKFGNVIRNTSALAIDNFIIGSTTLDDDTSIATDNNRMFFNKAKGAFRAGNSNNGTNWDNTNIGIGSVAFGRNTNAPALNSTAMGNFTTAFAANSTAMGSFTTASGVNSIAIGLSTTASGDTSTAMGNNTNASGTNSTAIGSRTTASGFNSTAVGQSTTASGTTSTAMGFFTTAYGVVSTAMGFVTKAESYAETAIGSYNTLATMPDAAAFIATDRLFTIGNGANAGALSNAIVVLKNGNTAIGNINPVVKLQVDGALAVSQTLESTTTITVGNHSYIGINVDNNTIVLSNGLVVGQILYLQKVSGLENFLIDSSNMNIEGSPINFNGKDMAQFIWDGNQWIMVSFSNNN